MPVKPYHVDFVETYADGFEWKFDSRFYGATHDSALRAAVAWNAQGLRSDMLREHGRLVSISAVIRADTAT
jgi:hypothetical protein